MKKENHSKVKKYLGISIIILLSICFFAFIVAFGWIAGIIWLTFFRKKLNTSPGKQKKYTLAISAASVLSLFIFIYAIATAPPSPTMLVLYSEIEGEMLEINSDYTITLQYEPSDATLSAVTYKVDTPSLAEITTDSDNPSQLTLHTNSEGTINITAVRGSLESNTLSFEIIDSARIEQEKAAETAKIAETEKATEIAKESDAEKLADAKNTTDGIPPKEETTPESTDTESFNGTKQKSENPLGFNIMFNKTYPKDTTGNWRLSRIAENIHIEEYALDYYNNYFESDNEIHIIVNFALNTTTRITVIGNILDVSIMEYVDKEELDASLACSGMPLDEYHINIDTGEIEKVTAQDAVETQADNSSSQPTEKSTTPINVPEEQAANISSAQALESAAQQPTEAPASETPAQQPAEAPANNNTSSGSNNSNFNTYDNPEQQQTTDAYVLNTSRHKIHYPSCSSVAKIAPQNYATSNASISELEAQGYTTCGICFK